MCAWEIAFRIKHDYPLIRMSQNHPGTKITMWCVWNQEMVHTPGDTEDVIREVDDYMKSIGRSIESYKPAKDGFLLTLNCSCDVNPNSWDITSRNNCVDIHPAVFLDGWGYYRVISFDEGNTKNMFRDLSALGTVELLSKKKLHTDALPSTVWTESFFSGMTEKQIESLVKAYDYGYYSSPREVTTSSIASSIGISRSTYEEHLRKAENRVMEAIIPYLKLFRAGVPKKERIESISVAITETR